MTAHDLHDRRTLDRQVARCRARGWWSRRLSLELDRAVVAEEARRERWERARWAWIAGERHE